MHTTHDTVHFSEHERYDRQVVREISRVTWVGVAVNVTLAIFKTIGGIAAASGALIADAVHTLSDLATDAAILIGVKYWSAPADVEHPHGHQKIETLVTLAIGIALALVGLGLGYEAVATLARELMHTDHHQPAVTSAADYVALAAALTSLVAKELLYRWTAKRGVALGSSAVVANAWHHRSDAISSIPPALAIGGTMLASHYGHDMWYLDPIGTIIVCVLLLEASWGVTRPTLAALLDASADRRFCSAIRQTVLATPEVLGFHKIRTRCIGQGAVAVDLHILVKADLSVAKGHAIAGKVKHNILALNMNGARAVDVMVHVEPAEVNQLPLSADDPCGNNGSRDTLVDWREGE